MMKKFKIQAALLAVVMVMTACGVGGMAGYTSAAALGTSAPETSAGESGGSAGETGAPSGSSAATEKTAAGRTGSAAADSAPPTAAAQSGKEPAGRTDADRVESGIWTISGRVEAVGMNAITIRTADGQEISLLTEGAQVDVADGLREDINVTVSYKAENGDQIATFITDAIDAADGAEGGGTALETVVGVIEDGVMSSVTVKLDDGSTMTFLKEGAEIDVKDGLVIGMRIRVNYSSDGGNGPFYAVRIEEAK